MLTTNENKSCLGFWAVEDRVTQVFMGWVSLRADIAASGQTKTSVATLGYRFHQHYWGQGFATEAMRALLDRGFQETTVQLVQATTYEKNVGSIRVMEKLGMTFSNKFRYSEDELQNSDTTYLEDTVVWDGYDVRYTLTRENWRQISSGL